MGRSTFVTNLYPFGMTARLLLLGYDRTKLRNQKRTTGLSKTASSLSLVRKSYLKGKKLNSRHGYGSEQTLSHGPYESLAKEGIDCQKRIHTPRGHPQTFLMQFSRVERGYFQEGFRRTSNTFSSLLMQKEKRLACGVI